MKINYSYCSNSYGKNKKNLCKKKSFKFSRKIANREKYYIHREGKTSNLQKKSNTNRTSVFCIRKTQIQNKRL